MRYSQYKNINELCTSLHEALCYMQTTNSLTLVNDCILALSTIAETLEGLPKVEAEKPLKTITEIVNLFEDVQNNIERLIVLSGNLSKECENKLKYKIRVLFVAELSSKWDSMKSVYEAFLKHPDCEVDVVLEPIFRATKLPDGKVRSEIIYNPQYLDNLGINHIPFKNYDMEKIKPDITFISQPYESVTIPQFWPQNIAKHTKLVYLPYFTATSIEIKSVYTSFFKMPIEHYAWRIICQSDKMKEYYKIHGSKKGENVIVTGLPKWDYPMALNKDNTPCPEDWKEKIEGKKVFLYNTHYMAQFKEPTDSYRNILSVFLERNDIALIWRPHPMTDIVTRLYDPENHKNFKTWEHIAANSKNIIEDTTESYNASFVYTDALISPLSSILQQYLFMKKPICLITQSKYKSVSLFDFSKLYTVDNFDGIEQFVNFTLNNPLNCNYESTQLLNTYFGYADGNVGKRISKIIIDEFFKGETYG